MFDAWNTLIECYKNVKVLSENDFMAFIGTLIDQYAADHKWTREQTLEVLHMLSQVQEEIHDTIGAMTPTF